MELPAPASQPSRLPLEDQQHIDDAQHHCHEFHGAGRVELAQQRVDHVANGPSTFMTNTALSLASKLDPQLPHQPAHHDLVVTERSAVLILLVTTRSAPSVFRRSMQS